MREVSLDELRELAENARTALWDKANSCNRDVKVYCHWSAFTYDRCFDDYHVNIAGDGTIYVSSDDLSETLSHTWRRNTGSVGVTLCCCKDGGSDDLGDYPPTAIQIEMMAQVIAVLASALWLTIDKAHVLTHGEAADNEDGEYLHEPYGPKSTCERWDLEYLGTDESPSFNPYAEDGSRGGDVLRGKANFYKAQFE